MVTTGILPSQTHVWPGQTFTLSGSGLSPDQSEPLYIGTTQITTIRTNDSGTFQTQLTAPWGLPSGKTSIYLIDPSYDKVFTIFFVLGDWPTFHHDAARTGLSTYEKSLTASTVSSLGGNRQRGATGPSSRHQSLPTALSSSAPSTGTSMPSMRRRACRSGSSRRVGPWWTHRP